MLVELKLRGHIIDSLVLSKLLDKLEAIGVEAQATNIKIGAKREDLSEATFIIKTDDESKMQEAIKIAKKQGATEN